MGAAGSVPKAKLIIGLLAGDADVLREASRRLTRAFGAIDLSSPCWPFEATDYYRDEIGDTIVRQFISFESLVAQDQLAEIKRLTNDFERRIRDDLALPETRRPVNIDPGLITLSKLVLATTKDHAHRIYLGRGIHAEVTLRYSQRSWQPWPWTYPDYAAETYHPFFDQVRESLKARLHDSGHRPSDG